MSEEVPLKPITRSDIHKLETALIVATLLRPDVLEKIRESSERLTWIDSLAVAAGALARSKAGMSVDDIADDLGRAPGTIRRHLSGKTEAGRLVIETYEKFAREGVAIEPPPGLAGLASQERIKALEEKLSRARELARELLKVLEE